MAIMYRELKTDDDGTLAIAINADEADLLVSMNVDGEQLSIPLTPELARLFALDLEQMVDRMETLHNTPLGFGGAS